jgi:hypothetical protein
MATVMKRIGYGQVEPNHLSGIVTGQIYAQLPAHVKGSGKTTSADSIAQFEQGQFAKYDYANGEVNFDGDGEFMLVYNEEKLYDERKQNHKDFVYKTEDFTDGQIFPRLIRTYVGDIYTTNTIAVPNTSDTAEVGTVSLSVGDYLQVTASGANAGFLAKATGTGMPASGMVWKVVKEYTMPDGQNGVKIQRVQ